MGKFYVWQILHIFVIFIFMFQSIFAVTFNISWISTNPMFGAGLPTLNVHINDRLRFVCPENGTEPSVIRRVDYLSAEVCRLPSDSRASIVGACIKPNDSVLIRLREFSLMPNVLTYKPNRDYFFITTSTGEADGLENFAGGLCHKKGMRLKITIESKDTIPAKSDDRVMDEGKTDRKSAVATLETMRPNNPIFYIPVSGDLLNHLEAQRSGFDGPFYFSNGQMYRHKAPDEKFINSRLNGNIPIVAFSPFIAENKDGSIVIFSGDHGFKDQLEIESALQEKPNYGLTDISNVKSFPNALKANDNDKDFEIEYVDSTGANARFCSSGSSVLFVSIVVYYCIL